jgi:hypothetical protein
MATNGTTRAGEMIGEMSGRTAEAMAAWAEANQRVLREIVDLSVGAAKEGAKLYSELQQGAIEAMRESQASAMRWQAGGPEAPKDPMQWYQQAVAESVDHAQKFFRMLEGNAQAVIRSAERLQTSAAEAGKGIQQTFEATVTRVKDAYSRN